MLLLIPVSRAYAHAGAPQALAAQSTGAVLLSVTQLPLTTFVFLLGALVFYGLLYRSNLVPRWLSVWGLVSIPCYVVPAILALAGLPGESSAWSSALYLPMMLQEMALAAWMIFKGFSPSAASTPAERKPAASLSQRPA